MIGQVIYDFTSEPIKELRFLSNRLYAALGTAP